MKLQIIPATMSLAPNKIVSFVKYGNTNSGSNSIPLLLVKIAGSFQMLAGTSKTATCGHFKTGH
jgi:hypothetical protein